MAEFRVEFEVTEVVEKSLGVYAVDVLAESEEKARSLVEAFVLNVGSPVKIREVLGSTSSKRCAAVKKVARKP